MTTLANFPMKDQRTEKTADGKPPENASFDCVPECLAASIQYYDGGYVSGDELKDAEYGESYVNAGTKLSRYIDDATDRARAVYHINAESYTNADTKALTAQIHAWVKSGFPVIATIPSAWDTGHDAATLASPTFSTHVVVFYSEAATGRDNAPWLQAMNPWGGFAHYGTDNYWQVRLCYKQVWKVFKETTMALPYTKTPAGLLDYKAGELGPGFSKFVLDNKITTDLVTPGEVHTSGGVYCVFADMRALYWSQDTDVVDMGKSGRLLLTLATPVQITPPAVKAALAAAANVLHPYGDALNQVLDAQRIA